jgi:hypothetical protein
MDKINSNVLLKVQAELYRLLALQAELYSPPENKPLEFGPPQVLVGFLSGVLGIPVEEITSDVIWKQDMVMDPNYEKLVRFSKAEYLGGGSWDGGIWFGSKAVDRDNEERESEDEEDPNGDYYGY